MTDEPSRTERYAARVDAHLPTLADDAARRAFLQTEHRKWEVRYDTFQVKVFRSANTPADGTAWDYVLTICEIEQRLSKYAEAAHAA